MALVRGNGNPNPIENSEMEKMFKKRKNVKKMLLLFIIAIVSAILSAGMSVWIIARIEGREKRKEGSFEQGLLEDEWKREQVEEFSSEENIRELFWQHEGEFQKFADECYKRQGRGMTFSVKEIDHMVFYLTDYPQLKAVQSGEYDYVTSFMNYAIENNLPYFYSDFEIRMPFPNGESKQGGGEADNWDELLKITLYKSKGLEASLIYSPHENMDDAGGIHVEEEGIDRYEKTVRINPNWYYLYIVTKIPGYWSPEIKISEQNK